MIDFDTFLQWANDRFGAENIKLKNTGHGTEICTHSFFARELIGKDDNRHHLWMNPSGGKSEHPENGSYRCWLTDKMGSLVSLVAKVDNIPWDEAEELITGTTSLRTLEKKVHEFFGFQEQIPQRPVEQARAEVALPDFTYLIDKLPEGYPWGIKAKSYLAERKLPSAGLYICTIEPKYGNRIIIPWYNADGKLVFWNGRTLSQSNKVARYMKPGEEDQKDVLFLTSWPGRGKIYIMEGELDAISLQLAGLVGCACGGKHLSEEQVEMLRPYEPVLAFDADSPGLEATINIGNLLLEKGFPKISYVRPPKIFKDWNKMLVHKDMTTIQTYIRKFEKPFTPVTADFLLSQRL